MSTSFSFATALIKVKALGEGTEFYASDIGAKGGTINALKIQGYIEKTGNTKSYLIPIGDGYFKEVEVYEWRVYDKYAVDPHYEWLREYREKRFNKMVADIKSAYEALQTLVLY